MEKNEREAGKIQRDLKTSDDRVIAKIILDEKDFIGREDFFWGMMKFLFEHELRMAKKAFTFFWGGLQQFMNDPSMKKLEKKKEKFFLIGDAKKEVRLPRTLTLTRQEDGILLIFSGCPPSEGQSGDIEKSNFNLKPLPGTIGADNRINYKNILRFPKVENGEEIMTIQKKTEGSFGMTYDGKIILPKTVHDYPLKIGEGIVIKEVPDEHGILSKYCLIAGRRGVIDYERNPAGKVVKLSVMNKLKLRGVDRHSGDLGCKEGEEFSVELEIDGTIGPGFTVNSEEDIRIEGSEGGILKSKKNIETGNLHAGTKASAEGDLTCHNVFGSFVKAGKLMTIWGGVNDSTIEASELVLPRRKDGRPNSVSNLKGKIEFEAKFENVLFFNKNFISLGENLFSRKNEIAEEIPKREQETADASAKKTEKLTEIKSLIRRVFEKIDAKEKGAFLEIINSKELSGLDKFKNMSNLSDIEKIKKSFIEVEEAAKEEEEKKEKLEGLKKEAESIDKKLSEMSLRIFDSKLRATGQLTITVNDRKIIVEVKEDNRDALLDLKISYDLEKNLIIIDDSKSINAIARPSL